MQEIAHFDFNEAVRSIRKTDSELYKAIKESYEHEQHDGTPTNIDKHTFGIIAAVETVYHLGQSTGYVQGYAAAKEDQKKQEGK